ncbi:MAG: hypothetical protein M3132_14615 [Actinomycetia bacterium]|nr:hypothetical protein [Actinomycetes bacterium]
MNSRSLEEDLLDIPGVEGAEVDGSGSSPAGLRIRIAEGADQRAVGGEIRRVLTKHGLGTDTRLPGEDTPAEARSENDSDLPLVQPNVASVPEQEPEETKSDQTASSVAVLAPADKTDVSSPEHDSDTNKVIDLTDALTDKEDIDTVEHSEDSEPGITDTHEDAVDDAREPSPPAVEASPVPGSWTSSPPVTTPSAAVIASEEENAEPDRSDEIVPPADQQPLVAVVARIDHVAVAEGRDGIVVTVSATDGRTESQPASSTEGGVETAVVMAAARLAQPGIPDPLIIEIEDRRVEGVDIVMIVLDADGTVAAGSAIVGAGRSFALGRATWAALSL